MNKVQIEVVTEIHAVKAGAKAFKAAHDTERKRVKGILSSLRDSYKESYEKAMVQVNS